MHLVSQVHGYLLFLLPHRHVHKLARGNRFAILPEHVKPRDAISAMFDPIGFDLTHHLVPGVSV